MDKRVYFLMIVSFVVGMVELIIGGILDLIAEDLNVSEGKVGLLITVFSFIFAIFSPVLLVLTAGIERKKLTLISLSVFLLGNLVTVFSPTYSVLFIGRIISALSGALLIILCLVMAPTIVEPKYRGRAIGIVSMGVSGSLVLGIPIGLILGNAFGWRAPFVMITGLTILSMIGVYFWMSRVEPKPPRPLKILVTALKDSKIFTAQLATFLFMAGHYILYAYLTPFVKTTMGLDGTWLSVIYLIFGIAAVSGGGIGGTISDNYGAKPTIIGCMVIFSITLFIIPYTTFSIPLFLCILVIWGMMSWVLSPAMQSYLIETTPETADIQQSLNNSALHFGIAFGSLIGSIVIDKVSVEMNASIGGFFVILALFTVIYSMRKGASSYEKHFNL
ncbi:MAG TPA: MFS transporter [Candidatus Avamphibacillus sp.]|nr:MFS transporter [Candidatus Avamphibacillus sp.]